MYLSTRSRWPVEVSGPISVAGSSGLPTRIDLRQREKLFEERVGDLLVQQQARAGDAGLALVVEDGEGRAAHRGIERRIVEDDVGALAAEFELHALQISRRSLHDLACR